MARASCDGVGTSHDAQAFNRQMWRLPLSTRQQPCDVTKTQQILLHFSQSQTGDLEQLKCGQKGPSDIAAVK